MLNKNDLRINENSKLGLSGKYDDKSNKIMLVKWICLLAAIKYECYYFWSNTYIDF